MPGTAAHEHSRPRTFTRDLRLSIFSTWSGLEFLIETGALEVVKDAPEFLNVQIVSAKLGRGSASNSSSAARTGELLPRMRQIAYQRGKSRAEEIRRPPLQHDISTFEKTCLVYVGETLHVGSQGLLSCLVNALSNYEL
jgi:hypothetical protein